MCLHIVGKSFELRFTFCKQKKIKCKTKKLKKKPTIDLLRNARVKRENAQQQNAFIQSTLALLKSYAVIKPLQKNRVKDKNESKTHLQDENKMQILFLIHLKQ